MNNYLSTIDQENSQNPALKQSIGYEDTEQQEVTMKPRPLSSKNPYPPLQVARKAYAL